MKKLTVTLSIALISSLFFVFAGNLYSQQTIQKKTKLSTVKVPKYSVSILGGFSYVLSKANGDASGFQAVYTSGNGNIFTADNLGMQQGYGIMAVGKLATGKTRKFRFTGNLGYNFFYNTYNNKSNRTMWNLINLGTGVEYNFAPKAKESLYMGAEINYSLMFGAWQSDIVYPDNSVSNIYTKFKPASRFGAAITTGMEFRINRKTNLNVAIRGVWSNIFPKQNYESSQPYTSYVNDSGDKNGIQLNGQKNIFFMQIVTGVTLPLSYK